MSKRSGILAGTIRVTFDEHFPFTVFGKLEPFINRLAPGVVKAEVQYPGSSTEDGVVKLIALKNGCSDEFTVKVSGNDLVLHTMSIYAARNLGLMERRPTSRWVVGAWYIPHGSEYDKAEACYFFFDSKEDAEAFHFYNDHIPEMAMLFSIEEHDKTREKIKRLNNGA